jgi:hypothetical protein
VARSRNIKPGFYKNEDLAECSIWARYIFPGLWMLADREGRLEDRPKKIKGELLPFDGQDIEPLLAELAGKMDAQGVPFIVRYQNSAGRFIQISKFSTHQTPHYTEKASVIKPPDSGKYSAIKPQRLRESDGDEGGNTPGALQEYSENPQAIKGGAKPPDSLIPDSLIPDSRSLIPDTGGKARASRARKTPMPTDFAVSERVRAWAEGKGFDQLERHLEAFQRKCAMNGYVYANWDSAFMEAIDKDWAEIRSGRKAQVRGQPVDQFEANLATTENWQPPE